MGESRTAWGSIGAATAPPAASPKVARNAVSPVAVGRSESERTVYINATDSGLNAPFKYCGNRISTAKYTVLTFLPKNLFEQFRRAANFYFLVIALIQLVPGLSPVSPWTSLLPLIMVFAFTAIKEAVEDYRRHQTDKHINNSKTHILSPTGFRDELWMNVQVGDVLRLDKGSFVPADIVVVTTSEPQGMCYIETSNLDGETNLKVRQALPCTSSITEQNILQQLTGSRVVCEPPNNRLYKFVGSLYDNKGKGVPLQLKQVVLRGSVLRNTAWVFGIVVYAGHDTKLMRNGVGVPSKRSTLERQMNIEVGYIFLMMLATCIFSAVYAGIWIGRKGTMFSYLAIAADENAAVAGVVFFFTFIILYNVLIPISLYVSVEFVKVIQALLINMDVKMFHADSNTRAQARTSNLSEELGQVQYVFSDKTGTLTENEMNFMKCTVGGVSYGTGVTEVARGVAKRNGLKIPPRPPKGSFLFDDTSLLTDMVNEQCPAAPYISEFLTLLAVCHTVIPEPKPDGTVGYNAASPDEGALVEAARQLGFVFTGRTPDTVTIEVLGAEQTFEVLHVLEFNSTRKRMSVIVRAPNGELRLYTKGADTVMFELLSPSDTQELRDQTLMHLESFAKEGLRTLVVASRVLAPDEYEKWSPIFHEASVCMDNREARTDAAAALIEVNLRLIGGSAIEDKLQTGVPDCIKDLHAANINVWVLTGDKQETAINIGFACSLLISGMNVITINADEEGDTCTQLKHALETYGANSPDQNGLIIDGRTLEFALTVKTVSKLFLELCERCSAVVCCRVSPLQKALVVKLVRENVKGAVTLAIGDGANDVSMIAAAHVGVGISGKEGMQAVLAADYAVAQFRYLRRLLLVHGRWNYRRVSELILYSFYKNFAFCLTQFWFQFYCVFSGQTLIDSWFIATFNMLWTCTPVLALAILDQDVSAASSLQVPILYARGQKNKSFNTKLFFLWLGDAVYQSLILFFVPYLCYETGSIRTNGESDNIWALGTMVYTCVIVTVTLKLASMVQHWTVVNHITVWASLVGWFLFAFAYTAIPDFSIYYTMIMLCRSAAFWFALILTPVMCLLPARVVFFIRRQWWPEPFEIIQEMEKRRLVYHCPDGKKIEMDPHREVPDMETDDTVVDDEQWRPKLRKLLILMQAVRLLSHGNTRVFRGFHFAHEAGQAEFIVRQRSKGEIERLLMKARSLKKTSNKDGNHLPIGALIATASSSAIVVPELANQETTGETPMRASPSTALLSSQVLPPNTVLPSYGPSSLPKQGGQRVITPSKSTSMNAVDENFRDSQRGTPGKQVSLARGAAPDAGAGVLAMPPSSNPMRNGPMNISQPLSSEHSLSRPELEFLSFSEPRMSDSMSGARLTSPKPSPRGPPGVDAAGATGAVGATSPPHVSPRQPPPLVRRNTGSLQSLDNLLEEADVLGVLTPAGHAQGAQSVLNSSLNISTPGLTGLSAGVSGAGQTHSSASRMGGTGTGTDERFSGTAGRSDRADDGFSLSASVARRGVEDRSLGASSAGRTIEDRRQSVASSASRRMSSEYNNSMPAGRKLSGAGVSDVGAPPGRKTSPKQAGGARPT